MPRKIQMQDQAGAHKVKAIMQNYDHSLLEMWMMKFMVVGAFLLLGVSW